MFRALGKLTFLMLLAIGGWACIVYYHDRVGAIDPRVAQLQQQKQELQAVVSRLTAERRVAELLVTKQSPQPSGVDQTTLLFVEYGHDGQPLPPKRFTISGNEVHLDAMVIKFERGKIGRGDDPLRGHSIALFHKLYGDRQAPAQGFAIDAPDSIPDYYRGSDPQVSAFEQNLWKNFWRLADDPAYRQQQQVRVANGQGIWFRASPQKLYTITLESDGGLNYSWQPIAGIYEAAMESERPPSPADAKPRN